MQRQKRFMVNKKAQELYEELIKNDPRFSKFARDNMNRTLEDIAKAYDVDLATLRKFM